MVDAPRLMPEILLHIGYHKTGSRWLRDLFFSNPATGYGWVDKNGEEHPVRRLVGARPFEFDAAASRAEFEPLLAKIVDAGLSPVVSFERFSGNPFSGGYDSKEIADRLVQVFPDARVLAVIREQRSMIVSTYKQYVREGGALPASKFMVPPTSRSMRIPWFDLRHFEYHHLLGYYRRLFGEDRVLALPYEQFRADPRSFVERLAAFAGRPLSEEQLDALPFESQTNPGPPATAIAARRWLNGLGVRSDLNPAPPLAAPAFQKLGKRIDRLSLAPKRAVTHEEEKLRRTVAEKVGERYVESNRLTAELTGIDLGAYGWMI
ncbi:MAG TPA: sulfotransferase domain-containing protein [Gaiellaceae bacterium]|nr:sulfotransferase domain-containing protein [Gaiellaceae bacterium]